MKRLTCVLMAVVVTVAAVRPAEAVYLGTYYRSYPYSLEVQGATQISITILSVTTWGKLEVVDVLTIDGTVVNAQSRTIPNNAQRFIFKVDVFVNSTAMFRIAQAHMFEIPVDGHEEVVFDIAP
jgi:hypothetical protein